MPTDVPRQRHAVVAGILIRDDRVLLCLRSARREWYPNVWDFPGGHVESQETPPAALVRELREELGIEISPPMGECLTRLRGAEFDMRVWLIKEWTGRPENVAPDEHVQLGWFGSSEMFDLELADERYPALIAEALLKAK